MSTLFYKNYLINNFYRYKTTKLNIKLFLIYSFFFFLPVIYTYPGRAYFHLIHLHTDRPFTWINLMLMPTIIISMCLIIIRIINRDYHVRTMSSMNFLFLTIISLWFIGGTIGFFSNKDVPLTDLFYTSIYISTLLIALAFINMALSEKEYYKIFVAISLGALIPLTTGITSYYLTHGIPAANVFYYAHCDLVATHRYSELTFGNTANLAQFIVLIAPSLLALIFSKETPRLEKSLFSVTFFFAIINLFFVSSRAAFLVFFLACFFVCYNKSVKTLIIYLFACIIIYLILSYQFHPYINCLKNAMNNGASTVKLNTIASGSTHSIKKEDTSVNERFQAMQAGWNIFKKHPFTGLGPGSSLYYNPFTSAHQFNIQQASETGFIGFFASILLLIYAGLRLLTLTLKKSSGLNYERFALLIGPVSLLAYGFLANISLSLGTTNTWLALMISMLALTECRAFYKAKNTQSTSY